VPTYVFTCIRCGKIQEVSASYEKLAEIEEHLKCDKCGGDVKRKLAPFVTHFNYTRGNK
jgi:predicted nucleic acid-binding Zn ribbon protein